MILCDTSTIAKFCDFELESDAVRIRLDAEDAVCVSELVRVEIMGVFHRRLRDGKWSRDDFLNAAGQFAAEDIRGYWTHSFLERLDAEVRRHAVVYPPAQGPTAEPIDHRDQIHKAAGHRDVGHVCRLLDVGTTLRSRS